MEEKARHFGATEFPAWFYISKYFYFRIEEYAPKFDNRLRLFFIWA